MHVGGFAFTTSLQPSQEYSTVEETSAEVREVRVQDERLARCRLIQILTSRISDFVICLLDSVLHINK